MKNRAVCSVFRAAVACAAVIVSFHASAALTAKSYITDGLIGHWDGIENVSYGGDRDATATTWNDLVDGSLNFSVPNGASFATDETGLTTVRDNGSQTTDAAWKDSKEYSAFKAANYTAEVAYRQDTAVGATGGGYKYRITFISLGADAYWLGARAENTLGFNGSFGSESTLSVYRNMGSNGTLGKHTLSCSHGEGIAKVIVDGDTDKAVTAEKTGAESPTTYRGFCFNKPGIWDNNGLPGCYYSIRFYDRVLTDDERVVNNAVDQVRYFGADPTTLTLPTGWAFEGSGGDVKLMRNASITVSHPGRGKVSVNGGAAAESATYLCEHNGEPVSLSLVAEPNEGFEFVCWQGGGLSVTDRLKASVTADVSGDIVAVFRRIVRISPRAYSKEGLVGLWDGVENAGFGKPHDPTATQWIDLSGGGLALAKPTAAYFVENGLLAFRSQSAIDAEAAWKASPAYTAFSSGNYSIEVAYHQHELMPIGSGTGWQNRAGLLTVSTDAYWIGTMNNNKVGFNGTFGSDYTLDKGVTMPITEPRGEHTISCSHHCVDGDKTAKLCFDESIATAQKDPATTIATSRGLQIGGIGWSRTGNSTDATYLSLRFYDHALSDDERLLNRAIDRVRCFSEEPEDVPLPAGYMFDTTDGVRLLRNCAITAEPAGAGTIAVDGGEAKAAQAYWGDVCVDTRMSLVAEAAEGYAFAGWRAEGLTDDQKLEPTLTADFTGPIAAIFRKTDGSDVRTYTWSGTATDRLDNPKLWHDADGLPGVPAAFDNVMIPSATAATLTNATPVYGSVTVGGTLVMRDWTAKLAAADVTVANGGVIKPEGPFGNEEMSNRVWIVCGNLTVAAGGKINADLCGYKGKNGPGGATSDYQAGSHGGKAGVGPGAPYGSLEEPETAGSGGGKAERSGGGIVRIDASGAARVNGLVTANGSASSVWNGGGGAGGSVWINCRTIEGEGTVCANGGDHEGGYEVGWYHGGGGGGRLSVRYDKTAQAEKDDALCQVRFEARGGYSGHMLTSGRWDQNYPCYFGQLGTLYFTDNRFLTAAAYRSAGWKFSGLWHSGEELADGYTFAEDFTLDTCWLDLQKPVDLTFERNLLVRGSAHARVSRLMVNGATLKVLGDLTLKKGGAVSVEGGNMTVGGALTVDGSAGDTFYNGAELHLIAGPTNSPNAYGATLTVGGDLLVRKYGTIFLECCATNGAIPKIVAANVDIATNGVLNANSKGWGNGLGYGCGGSNGYTGGAYGGFGGTHAKGKNRRTYGSRKHPLDPGSSTDSTVRGGGVIYLTTHGKLCIHGKVDASAQNWHTTWHSSGSGGSVYLSCHKLLPSTGKVMANGGAGGGYDSQGGGGRIAIYACDGSTNGLSVTANAGEMQSASIYSAYDPATDGTVYWKLKTGLRVFVR